MKNINELGEGVKKKEEEKPSDHPCWTKPTEEKKVEPKVEERKGGRNEPSSDTTKKNTITDINEL